MKTAYLCARLLMTGPQPVMDAIIVASDAPAGLTTMRGYRWLALAHRHGPTLEQAEAELLAQARLDYTLAELLERLYVAPAGSPARGAVMQGRQAPRARRS